MRLLVFPVVPELKAKYDGLPGHGVAADVQVGGAGGVGDPRDGQSRHDEQRCGVARGAGVEYAPGVAPPGQHLGVGRPCHG